MSTHNPANHKAAYTQAYHFMIGSLKGKGQKEKHMTAKRCGNIAAAIWKKNHVGIFQIRRSDIEYYTLNILADMQIDKSILYHDALLDLISALGKEHWLPIYHNNFEVLPDIALLAYIHIIENCDVE